MTEKRYELKPRDLLFFRDGRPMDVDKQQPDVRNVGHGASWPRPDHLFKGVIHALVGDRMASLDEGGYGAFPQVRVRGPYPVKDGVPYLPRPLDWDMARVDCKAETDIPEPLEMGFLDRREGKKAYPAWIALEDFAAYLAGRDHDGHVVAEKDEDGNDMETVKFPYGDGDLFTSEPRVGNTLDAATGASRKVPDEHRSGSYQADYLRLRKGVSMWCTVETGRKAGGSEAPEAPEVPASFVMGGQGGVVTRDVTEIDLAAALPAPAAKEGQLVRWTLIAPAYFPGNGWLPDFCVDTSPAGNPLGTVMLRDGKDAPLIGARLVGACVGKPVAYSGWDTKNKVKPTQLAVPAGSVYLFRCRDVAAANALIAKLHLVPRSQNSAQGFGIGVCSLVDDVK